jgi:hypothetical protein
MRNILTIVLAAAVVLACRSDPSRAPLHVDLPGTAVAVAEIRTNAAPPPAPARTDYSGYAEPARLVIRSQDEWASAWATIHEGVSGTPASLPPLPPVDFSADMVVVAATGTRGSAAYDIVITNAALDAGTLRVGVVETKAGAGCGYAAVLTRPVAAATVARHDGAVEFVDDNVSVPCE